MAVVKLKRSEVADRVPSSVDLDEGELAVNLEDAKLFSKKSDGTIVTLNPITNNTTNSSYLPNDLGSITSAGSGTYNLGLVTDSSSADNAGFNELSANEFTLGDQIFPTSDGTSGQVMVTDGSGQLSWTDVPAGKLHVTDVLRLKPSSTPSSPSEGDMYMDSTTHKLMVYDGTTWQACW